MIVIVPRNPLSASPTKWSNTLKTIQQLLPTNCLSVFAHFGGVTFKGLMSNFSPYLQLQITWYAYAKQNQMFVSNMMLCTIFVRFVQLKKSKKRLLKLAPPWMFFTSFKLNRWYQIMQNVSKMVKILLTG